MTAAADGAILAATDIGKRFDALVVLEAVALSMRADEAIGIVGPNGAGKTTLLNVLSGATKPNHGRVTFKGSDITELPAASRCRLGLGRTHQIPRPFLGMTVFENAFVAAAHGAGLPRDEAYDQAISALELSGMMRHANHQAASLGLLDRKRLELARALAARPSLLLLDEIGGGLTDAEANELVGMIKELRRRNIAIVWIEHIVHVLVQVADRLICMDAGRIIADGTPDVVLADPGVIRAYLGGEVT
jgi:branched-chain amino acid transport system ATP-binding protein